MTAFTHDYPASSYNLASPLKRLYAIAIDVSIAHIIVVAGEYSLRFLIGPLLPPGDWSSLAKTLIMILWLIPYLYLVFGDALPGGQTLGKRVMKIAVVTFPFEKKCTLLKAALRNVPKLVLGVVDWVFMFFGHRRRLGDMIAGTIVVNTCDTQEPPSDRP